MPTAGRGASNAHDRKRTRAMNAPRYTWRKRRTRSGLQSYAPSHSLHRGDDNWLAIVQQDKKTGMWYWYGDGQNTSHMMADLETAKREAFAYITRNEK